MRLWGVMILTLEWSWVQTFIIPTLYYTYANNYRHLRVGFLAGAIGIAWGKLE
jgi:hypothetical protein